ncbi:MAG: flagellar hook-length control protein FliK [Campylobacterota bacterium]
MLQAALTNDSINPKQTPDSTASKEDEKGGSAFKDLFTKVVTKGVTKDQNGENKQSQNQATDETKAAQTENLQKNEGENKTLNNLLNSILQSSKKTKDLPLGDLTLKDKLSKAKNILESTLNKQIDMKELKDTKSLKELIVLANKKGLNISNVKLESQPQIKGGNKDRASSDQNPKEPKEAVNQNSTTQEGKRVPQSSIVASLLHKNSTQSKNTLSAMLSKEEAPKEVKTTLQSLLSSSKEGKSSQSAETLMQNSTAQSKEGKENGVLNALLAHRDVMDKTNGGEKRSLQDTLQKILSQKGQQLNGSEQKSGMQKQFMQTMQSKLNIGKESLMSELEAIVSGESKTAAEPVKAGIGAAQGMSEKIQVAKSTISNFASSLKEQVQNYKPPISKLTLTLNPKSLGEVDVVIKSRGDNLSVQISSSTAPALQVLAQNSMELRQNLANMGFDNLSMQFSSNSGGSGAQGGQKGFEQEAAQHYVTEDELDEEAIAHLESIEINLPKYV